MLEAVDLCEVCGEPMVLDVDGTWWHDLRGNTISKKLLLSGVHPTS